jgi:hypothetical protein
VSNGTHPDPRIVSALALLQDYLRNAGSDDAPLAPAGSHEPHWLESSTDILTPWYPATADSPASGWTPAPPTAGAWDNYFASLPPSFHGDGGLGRARRGRPGAEIDRLEPGDSGLSEMPSPLEPASSDADLDVAEAVIESLYEFLHAIGRADVPAAMQWVSADYHAMEGDREITHDVLRHQIEDLVDARRGRGLDVSLANVPEPIPHPLGVLVKLCVQVDSRNAQDVPESLLLHRVAVFGQAEDGLWRLASLGIVDPVP